MNRYAVVLMIVCLVSVATAQKSILFLAGAGQDAGGPRDADVFLVEMMEDLGYEVEHFYLDDPSKMTEDLGMDRDLVIASSTILSTHVGEFYIDKAVPVLTWESGMYPKLGIATAGSNAFVSEIFLNIVAEGHPAMGEYTGEIEALLDSPLELTITDTSTLCDGAEVLAEVIDDNGFPMVAIFAVEEGATLIDSTAAPARRLGFFFRDETSLQASIDALNLFSLCARWTMGDLEASVDELKTQLQYQLRQNFPNPFNPSTRIEFHVSVSSDVHLTIYNHLGQRIRTLYAGPLSAGMHTLTWNGMNEYGNQAPNGIYFYELYTENVVLRKKMVLTK